MSSPYPPSQGILQTFTPAEYDFLRETIFSNQACFDKEKQCINWSAYHYMHTGLRFPYLDRTLEDLQFVGEAFIAWIGFFTAENEDLIIDWGSRMPVDQTAMAHWFHFSTNIWPRNASHPPVGRLDYASQNEFIAPLWFKFAYEFLTIIPLHEQIRLVDAIYTQYPGPLDDGKWHAIAVEHNRVSALPRSVAALKRQLYGVIIPLTRGFTEVQDMWLKELLQTYTMGHHQHRNPAATEESYRQSVFHRFQRWALTFQFRPIPAWSSPENLQLTWKVLEKNTETHGVHAGRTCSFPFYFIDRSLQA